MMHSYLVRPLITVPLHFYVLGLYFNRMHSLPPMHTHTHTFQGGVAEPSYIIIALFNLINQWYTIQDIEMLQTILKFIQMLGITCKIRQITAGYNHTILPV